MFWLPHYKYNISIYTKEFLQTVGPAATTYEWWYDDDKGLQLLPGDKVVEVKNMEINKGKAALSLVEQSDYDFIMALGDDFTDEDLFKALPDSAVTIKVGTGASSAKFFVRNPTEVRGLLASLGESVPAL